MNAGGPVEDLRPLGELRPCTLCKAVCYMRSGYYLIQAPCVGRDCHQPHSQTGLWRLQ